MAAGQLHSHLASFHRMTPRADSWNAMGDTPVACAEISRKMQERLQILGDILGSSAEISNRSGISSQIFCLTAAARATWERTAFIDCKITAAGARMPEMQGRNGCGGGSVGHRARTGHAQAPPFHLGPFANAHAQPQKSHCYCI
jgi:hypothetical protein